ncbi:hypothetical protein WEN_00215 [Mycoplasma wenyonii str. Massachusetts]|uniref:Uncharacterized protein n=1 Tax=Mycoplasma wenyonii (strain Massachusetts) TaxID=1197325 RepID=I6ZI56_MYCWM|nr:hypothetical protein [Mycoplasma wenyonii]AFN64850.1 hypothetical protein WEN_00215 [Mycoplasma wenyonii str. Massachusetts]
MTIGIKILSSTLGIIGIVGSGAVPVALWQTGYFETKREGDKSFTLDNQQSSRVAGSAGKVATSKEQLAQDEIFESCLKNNLKFQVKDVGGGIKWVNYGEYSFSVHGVALDSQYSPNQCSREVPSK